MKPRACAVNVAALVILVCSLALLGRREKGRQMRRQEMKEALQTWEGEGGAILVSS
jgi:hypothetical protein